jgi:tRNA(fMet)-specific endonuclease VapC
MLDTNIVSDLIINPQGKVAKRIAKLGEDNICTSIIVTAAALLQREERFEATA